MRVLFAFSGGSGHLEPLVPLVLAARSAGHQVALAGRPWMMPRIAELGLPGFAAGSDVGLEPVTRPLLEVDLDRELLDLRDGFGRRIARERAQDLVGICGRWRPDLMVWEETDFGAGIVAERLGLPHASVIVTASGAFVRPAVMAEALDEVRVEHGLPTDPAAEMLTRFLVLSPVPPSFRDPAFPAPPVAHGFRAFGPVGSSVDVSGRAAGSRPLVYFTLGTVFNHESGDLFPRVLAGLRDLPIELLVTVGREAGSGSVLGALAFGRPMVLLPMGADQSLNAERCAALGVGSVLDSVRATPEDVRAAASTVLAGPTYRAAVAPLRDEMAKLPSPKAAVGLLERLVRERRPIPAA